MPNIVVAGGRGGPNLDIGTVAYVSATAGAVEGGIGCRVEGVGDGDCGS